MVNVDLDRIRADGGIPVVELFLKLGPRKNKALSLGERGEQRVFLCGKNHWLALVNHFAGGRIDGELAADDDGIRPAGRTPQKSPDAGGKLFQVEGLHEIVVRPCVKPEDPIVQGVTGGGDEDRDPILLRADLLQHLYSVLPRQPEVEHHKAEGRRPYRDQRRVTVLQPVDGVAVSFQPLLHTFPDHRVGFNQTDSHSPLPRDFSLSILYQRIKRRTG